MTAHDPQHDPPSVGADKPEASDSPHHHTGWLFGLAVVVLVLLGLGLYQWFAHSGTAKETAVRPPRAVAVTTAVAEQGDLPIYLDALGTVNAYNTVTVRSRVDGQLDEVNFTEGQMVRAGQVLARIDARPFLAQLHQAEGQRARDQASLDNARLDLERYRNAGDAASKQQRDTAMSQVEQFEAAVKMDDAQIESARLQVDYCTIAAPITGRIGLRLVDQGNLIHASDGNGLAVITQTQPIAVVFSLPQDDLPQVLGAVEADPSLAVEAFNRDRRTRLAVGTLLATDNQIDPTTATVRFKAKFDNQDQHLFPNQFVNVRLLVETRRGVVLVPTPAVQRSPKVSFVYVVGHDDTVSVVPISVGPGEAGRTVIEQGLGAGQEVVTDGADELVAGMKVVRQTSAKQSAAAPGDAAMSRSSPAHAVTPD